LRDRSRLILNRGDQIGYVHDESALTSNRSRIGTPQRMTRCVNGRACIARPKCEWQLLDCNQLPIALETHFFMWLSGGTGFHVAVWRHRQLLGMYDALVQRWNDESPPRWRRE
jgi:hypothetical protein